MTACWPTTTPRTRRCSSPTWRPRCPNPPTAAGPTPSTCAPGSGTRPVPWFGRPTSYAVCGARCSRPDGPTSTSASSAARAASTAPASCDLSRGVVADDTQGRVTFHLVAPDPQFLYKLTLWVAPTPPGTSMGRLTSPVPGTGPYRIAAYTRNKRFTLARNTFFREWSAAAQPAGFLDGITWVKVADARAAADAVRQGRADLAELNPWPRTARPWGRSWIVSGSRCRAASTAASCSPPCSGSSTPPYRPSTTSWHAGRSTTRSTGGRPSS